MNGTYTAMRTPAFNFPSIDKWRLIIRIINH